MAERSKKISELTALTNASGDDLLIIVDQPGTANAATNKITVGNLFANVNTNTVFKQVVSVGANLTINTSAVRIGNSTVNTTITAGNIQLQGSTISVGNTTVNTVANDTSVSTTELISNSLTTTTITAAIGTITALTFDTANVATSLTAGDVIISANGITINSVSVSTFDGDYSSLANAPTVPEDLGDLTDTTDILGSTSTAALGDIRFEDNKIIGANNTNALGSVLIVPNNSAAYVGNGHYLEVYPTDPASLKQVHITAGANTDLFIGNSTWYFALTKTGGISINSNTINIDNVLTLERIEEAYDEYSNANGVFTLDCSYGHIFKFDSVAADFTPALTNFFLATGYATSVTLVLTQNSSPYAPTSNLQINGTNTTVSWAGGSITPNANKTDIVSYTVFNKDGTYTVFGQLSSYG